MAAPPPARAGSAGLALWCGPSRGGGRGAKSGLPIGGLGVARAPRKPNLPRSLLPLSCSWLPQSP
eukprot:425705-Alexandrium_andersonii.AAC.1